MNKFTIIQIRQAVANLPVEVRHFISDPDTTSIIEGLLNSNNINGDNAEQADTEILYCLWGLQSLTAAIENIAKITNRRVSEFDQLQADIESKILSKISEIKKQNEGKPIIRNPQPITANKIGDSFEKTILNQAIAMRRVGEAPANLPTSPNTPKFGPRNEENRAQPTQNNQQNAIHNYVPGSDPYREPVE